MMSAFLIHIFGLHVLRTLILREKKKKRRLADVELCEL